MAEISTLLAVSERTVYRRLHEFGIKVRDFTDVSNLILNENVLLLCEQFPNCGEQFLNQMLRQEKGLIIQRSRLRESISRVDILGVKRRKRPGLHRRIYNVSGSNHLWHIDTHHKLIRWHVIVVGAIDGFSRLPVVLDCTTDNKSETVLQCFIKGVKEYGMPLRLRSDKGLENVLVADYMLEHRGIESGCVITGKSTHNQRIERLWRDVFTGVLSYFYDLFYYLEDEGYLDPLDEHHLACLHYVIINKRLKLWRHAWANHRMRTTKTTPWKLWLSRQINSPIGNNLPNQNLEFYGVEGIISNISEVAENTRLFAEPLLLPQYIIDIINDTVDDDIYLDTTGISFFVEILKIANVHWF